MTLRLSLFLLPGFLLFYYLPDNQNASVEYKKIIEDRILTDDDVDFYNQLSDTGLSPEGLRKALTGFKKVLNEYDDVNRNLITIIDYSCPSVMKRLYVIDLLKKEIVYKSYVAHGKNSGLNHATSFSNRFQSHQSSLGFYITENTYFGKHGYSLRLKGLEKAFNDNAWKRSIVMHAASYVSEDFIQRNGRLGRSHGCPAIPVRNHQYLIDLIKDNTCLFVYYPDAGYLSESDYLK
jgi:hypothetical protein